MFKNFKQQQGDILNTKYEIMQKTNNNFPVTEFINTEGEFKDMTKHSPRPTIIWDKQNIK